MAKGKAQNASTSKGRQSSRQDAPPNQPLEVNDTPLVVVVNQQQFAILMNKIEALTICNNSPLSQIR